MKFLNSLSSALTLLLVFPCGASELPAGTFSLGNVQIGTTTLDVIRTSYGDTPLVRLSSDDSTEWALCYRIKNHQGRNVVVLFETSSMGSNNFVAGFRLMTTASNLECKATKISDKSVETHNGIRIGQSKETVGRALKKAKPSKGSFWRIESVAKRPATTQERVRLQQSWPNESDYFIDVTEIVTAKFYNGRLSDLHVRRIESY